MNYSAVPGDVEFIRNDFARDEAGAANAYRSLVRHQSAGQFAMTAYQDVAVRADYVKKVQNGIAIAVKGNTMQL